MTDVLDFQQTYLHGLMSLFFFNSSSQLKGFSKINKSNLFEPYICSGSFLTNYKCSTKNLFCKKNHNFSNYKCSIKNLF